MQTRPIDIGKLPAVPWKNGGGVTRTVAVSPDGAGFDDFAWRISIADVSQSGSFSPFPGVDRTIMLLDGHGMMLRQPNGSLCALTAPFRPWSMPGDEPVNAELVNGPARDFNVMVRRGRAQASVEVWRTEGSAGHHSGGHRGDALFYCARGSFQLGPAPLPAGWACFVADAQADLRFVPQTRDAILIGVLLKSPALS